MCNTTHHLTVRFGTLEFQHIVGNKWHNIHYVIQYDTILYNILNLFLQICHKNANFLALAELKITKLLICKIKSYQNIIELFALIVTLIIMLQASLFLNITITLQK